MFWAILRRPRSWMSHLPTWGRTPTGGPKARYRSSCAARRDWMHVSRSHSAAFVAGHDAPLIDERAAPRGRSNGMRCPFELQPREDGSNGALSSKRVIRNSEVIAGCRTGYNHVFHPGYDSRRTSDHETEGIWNRCGISRHGVERGCGFRTAGGGTSETRKLPSGRI